MGQPQLCSTPRGAYADVRASVFHAPLPPCVPAGATCAWCLSGSGHPCMTCFARTTTSPSRWPWCEVAPAVPACRLLPPACITSSQWGWPACTKNASTPHSCFCPDAFPHALASVARALHACKVVLLPLPLPLPVVGARLCAAATGERPVHARAGPCAHRPQARCVGGCGWAGAAEGTAGRCWAGPSGAHQLAGCESVAVLVPTVSVWPFLHACAC